MKPFFNVQSVAAVQTLAGEAPVLGAEDAPLAACAGRTLATDLAAPHDLPGFTRSTMDGFAVRARDTFGCSETQPAYLELSGEVVMGQTPDFTVEQGQCARIFTGGMLPAGADAVLMVEHTRMAGDTTLEAAKSVAPGDNILGPTDDAAQGQVLLHAGHELRPQDIGLMAGLGIESAGVIRRPRVAIISTGDEVVPISEAPGPGQVRDVNTYTLEQLVRRAGGDPRVMGLVPDDRPALEATVGQALKSCDLVLLSGGSSVGTRDLTAEVFESFPKAELLVHGVAVSPGKPFIWVRAGEKHLLGLPGQVASCMVAFHVLVEPLLEAMLGRPPLAFRRFGRIKGELARNIPSTPGREDYIRAKLASNNGTAMIEPVFGKSGLITTLVQGHGLVRIPADSEGLYQGETVEMLLFP